MLINLSSINQPDHAKFSNYFNETMRIPKDAVLCLVKGQVSQDDSGKSLIIIANTSLCIKWDSYNQQQFFLNPGEDTTYTPEAFVNYILTLVPDNTCPGYGQRFLIRNDGDDTILSFIIYRNPVGQFFPDVMNHVYGNNNYKRFYIGDCKDGGGGNLALPTTGPGNTGAGTLQTQFGRSTLPLNTAGMTVSIWDPAYLPPLTMPNRFANQLSVTDGNNSFTRFILGRGNIDEARIDCGRCVMEDANTATIGPYLTSETIQNPAAQGDHNFALRFRGTGVLELDGYDNEQETMARTLIAQQNPGDMITISFGEIDPQYVDPLESHIYHPVIQTNYNAGLTHWCSLRGQNNFYYNNAAGIVLPVPLDQFYLDNFTKDSGHMTQRMNDSGFFNNGYTGPKRTAGYSLDGGANTTEPATGCAFICDPNSTTPQAIVGRISPTAYDTNRDMKHLYRYVLTTNNGPVAPNHKGIFKISDTPFPLTNPWAISMNIGPSNDAQQRPAGSDNIQSWFCNDTNPIITFYIDQAATTAGYDVRVRQSDGQFKTCVLADPAGQRIPTLLSTYFLNIIYDGNLQSLAIPRRMKICVGNYNTGTVYTGFITLDADLEDLKNIGGILPTNNAADYTNWASGYFNDFRFYERSAIDPPPTGPTFGDGRPALTNQWCQTLLDKIWTIYRDPTSTNWENNIGDNDVFFGVNNQVTLFPRAPITGQLLSTYTNNTPPNPLVSNTLGITMNAHATSSFDTNWFDFLNLASPNCLRLPIANQYTTNLASGYTGVEKGLVNTLGLQEDLDFFLPPPDADDNVVEQPTVRAAFGVDNPIINLSANLEDVALDHDVMNVEITNLPHLSYNGANHQVDKTIYQIPAVGVDRVNVDNIDVIEVTPPNKVWIDLNNTSEIPINKLDVQISDKLGKKIENLKPSTNISLEIQSKNNVSL